MRASLPPPENQSFQIAPMVDVIFILILFFMCSAAIVQVEQQLNITLPGMLVQAKEVPMVDEQTIEIMDNGQVVLNTSPYDKPDSKQLPELIGVLERYKAISDASHNQALITISPSKKARYQRVIDVLDACTMANVTNVTFGTGSE